MKMSEGKKELLAGVGSELLAEDGLPDGAGDKLSAEDGLPVKAGDELLAEGGLSGGAGGKLSAEAEGEVLGKRRNTIRIKMELQMEKRLSNEKSQMEKASYRKASKVSVSIENTGIFIPEESLPHLFEAFYRVDPSRSRQTGGTGLGLYIVKMILEQHGAEYSISNTKEGVCAAFSL